MIVADANLIVYRYVSGPFTNTARAVLAKDPEWRTAPLWRIEFTSAVVKLIRAKLFDEADALLAMSRAVTEMSVREVHVPQDHAMRVALRCGISAYDAQYVALAEILGLRCVTADAPLARKTPMTSVLANDFVR